MVGGAIADSALTLCPSRISCSLHKPMWEVREYEILRADLLCRSGGDWLLLSRRSGCFAKPSDVKVWKEETNDV
jgi:hypothetical protein